MKKVLVIAVALALLQLRGITSNAATFTPTTCPTNYSCSLVASGTHPLVGSPNDGHPSSFIGVVTFDASSKVSGFLAINVNGKTSSFDASGATCVSGTGGQLGQIDFTSPAGHPLVFDFVTYAGAAGQGMLFADATPSSTNSTAVLVARCMISPFPPAP